MTEEQIIAMGLSDKRERALIAVRVSGNHVTDKFWSFVSIKLWGLAATELLVFSDDDDEDTEFYADAIWEG